jgi:hypothetical protein
MATEQVVEEPEQAPVQPEKAFPEAGVAVRVTTVPPAKLWLHPLEPAQLIPAGFEVTLPLPPTVTCSESFCTTAAKVAPTLSAPFNVTVQEAALPEQAPVQPTKALPEAAEAVRVTAVPFAYDWLQVPAPAQSMPAGFEVTDPAPPTVTCSASICTAGAKLAATLCVVLIASTQLDAPPEHAPLHPRNAWPDAGAAFSVTIVPCVNACVQLLGPTQSSPVGLDVTVPEPPTATATVSA